MNAHGIAFNRGRVEVLAQSESKRVLDLVRRNKRISAPKLVAKAKISTTDLDDVLNRLKLEGLITIKKDRFGFDRVEEVTSHPWVDSQRAQ